MPESVSNPTSPSDVPDFSELVSFLVRPFLERPESIRVDCELSPSRRKVWVRLAFDADDKGRVFGRGGRNIQAIRTVLSAAAQAAGYAAYLDVYGSPASSRDDELQGDSHSASERRAPARRASQRGGLRSPSR
jgi:predicted RNA-binding protein YlqC (UPF0109 family)